jgi:PAS domain S-box-containing protein
MGLVFAFSLDDEILKKLQAKIPADDLRICADLDQASRLFKSIQFHSRSEAGILDLVIMGSKFPEPIQMAKRIDALDRTISIIVICPQAELERVNRAFQFSLFVDGQVNCVAEEDHDEILLAVEGGINTTQAKRRHSLVMQKIAAEVSEVVKPHRQAPIHLDKVLDYAPIAVAIINANGNILAWNRKAKEITGFNEREVLFKPFHALFVDDAVVISEASRKAQASSSSSTAEVSQDLDQKKRFFEMTFGPLGSGDGNLMVVFHDISQRKENEFELRSAKEQAEAANEAKTRFLAIMSHEIRTPIGAILGFLDLIRQPETSSAEKNEFIATIDRNGRHLLELIEDILDLSKIEAGKVSIVRHLFSLPEFLGDLRSVTNFRAQEKGLEFRILLETRIPKMVETDGVRLRQILSNVLGNAIKFTERGSVVMKVKYAPGRLRFTVEDTGIGMTEEQIKNLFTPFSQGDNTISRKFGGTGLGLALSSNLTKALGGDLRLLRSVPRGGSAFELQLPVGVAEKIEMVGSESMDESRKASPQVFAEQKNHLAGMRVLVVEDSSDNRVLVSRFLTIAGAEAAFAYDGADGIEKALGGKYDVVLMDMRMPVCDGLEATKRLRARGYDRPIIAFTAHAMEEERRNALEAGCSDYLTKPIDKQRLINTLGRYRSLAAH